MNYIYSEILWYDILKQRSDSFENMNLYSLVYEVFQNNELKSAEEEASDFTQSYMRQVNFYLRIYEKCISHLSITSPSSVASSLNLIFRQLENQETDSCFSLKADSNSDITPGFIEHQIVDRLYHCAMLSSSQVVIITIFHEIEQIAKHLIENNWNLELISNAILRHQRLIECSELKYDIWLYLLTLLSNILSFEIKNNYLEYKEGGGVQRLANISILIKWIIVPIVDTCNSVIRQSDRRTSKIKSDLLELAEFNSSLTKVMRDIWGYLMIYRGLSDQSISIADIFNPLVFYSTELMSLAYFITPPLIIDSSKEHSNSLLDPEFPPEIVGLLRDPLVTYLSKTYSKHRRVFEKLSEDLVVLIGQIDFVSGLQLVYIKNVAVGNTDENMPLPHIVDDIFYYLSHPDIVPEKDVGDIITTQSQCFLKEYFDIILHNDLWSSFVRDTVAQNFASFILNACDNWDYVNKMINRYPYMLLWKPVLMSFVKVIDQLAHLMYLEFGKIPEIQLNVRARLWSNSNKPVFEELLMRLKVLSFIAMVSDYTSLEILVSTIQSENSDDKLFSVPLESKIHNFTVSTIMKWMSEFFRGDSEYKTKIELLLGTSQIPPSQFPPPIFDVAKTVSNPIPVLEFENSNVKPFMKRIHYYRKSL